MEHLSVGNRLQVAHYKLLVKKKLHLALFFDIGDLAFIEIWILELEL
jgi:hypothetical protein